MQSREEDSSKVIESSSSGRFIDNDSNCGNGVAFGSGEGREGEDFESSNVHTAPVVLRQRQWTKTSRRCDNQDQAVRNKRASSSTVKADSSLITLAHLTADSHRDGVIFCNCDFSPFRRGLGIVKTTRSSQNNMKKL